MLALVAGTGRSGTTLVQETLSRHQAIGFVSGLDDKLPQLNRKGRFNRRLYALASQRPASMRALGESPLLEPRRLRVAPSEAYRLIDRQVMSGFSAPCRDLRADDMTPYLKARFVDFFESRRLAQGADVFLQHVTGWPRTGLLREAFPDLKVVNVIRDGRAVSSSWLQMGWWDGWLGPDKWIYGPLPQHLQEEWEDHDRSFAVLAALGWRMLMTAYEAARDETPPGQWLDVRYEDVLQAPRQQFAVMLDFLGLEWDEAFEAGFTRHEVTRGRAGSYRDELSAGQLASVEKVLAEPLQRWGYSVDS